MAAADAILMPIVPMIEFLILAVVLWPIAVLLLDRSFRRKLRPYPFGAIALFALIGSYVWLVAILAMRFPTGLHVAASIGLLCLVFERWRARPHYGCERGLPPGSLALAPLGPLRDHLFYRRQAQRHGPVFKMSHYFEPMVCVVGHERGIDLLRAHDADLGVPALPFTRLIPRGYIRYMGAADHEKYQALLRTGFRADVVRAGEPVVAAVVRSTLAEMVRSGEGGVRPHEYLDRIVFASFAYTFFGIDRKDSAFERLAKLYDVVDHRNISSRSSRRLDAALTEICQIVTARARELPPCALTAIAQSHRTAVDDPTLLRNLIFILQTSRVDVGELLLWVVRLVGAHPEWLDRVRDADAPSGGRPDVGRANPHGNAPPGAKRLSL